MIQLFNEYLDDLMVRMAHHSTAIEGNTLTQGETKSVLIDNYIPRPMNMRELNEVLNYKFLMSFFKDSLLQDKAISIEFIKELHRIICKDAIEGNPGEFKRIQNLVIGADWDPTPPYLVFTDLQNWILDLDCQIKNAKNDIEILAAILRQHIRFERIHPFSDGNGRVGRALIVYSCLQQNMLPVVIPKEEKQKYISLLDTCNEQGLVVFSCKLQQKEEIRYNSFKNNINKAGIRHNR